MGDVHPLGGRGPPMRALFSENVCKKERIGSHRGWRVPCTPSPPRSANAEVETVLQLWIHSGLALMGKILVVNSLAASLFVYKMSVLPNIPRKHTDKFYEIARNFLWKSDTPRLAKNILTLPKDQGGLRLVNLDAKQTSLKVQWVLNSVNDLFLTEVMSHNLIPNLGNYLWQCNLAANDLVKVTAYDRNNFWIQVFEAWCRFYYQDNVEPDKACYQII